MGPWHMWCQAFFSCLFQIPVTTETYSNWIDWLSALKRYHCLPLYFNHIGQYHGGLCVERLLDPTGTAFRLVISFHQPIIFSILSGHIKLNVQTVKKSTVSGTLLCHWHETWAAVPAFLNSDSTLCFPCLLEIKYILICFGEINMFQYSAIMLGRSKD